MKGKQGKRKKPNLKMKEAEAIRHREKILEDLRKLLENTENKGTKMYFDKPFTFCCVAHKKTWERINGRRIWHEARTCLSTRLRVL